MESTFYYRRPDGSLSVKAVGAPGDQQPQVVHPEGAVLLSEDEYRAELAAVEAHNAEHVADLQAAAQQRAREDYEALLAAGLPAATAARLSGHEHEEESL